MLGRIVVQRVREPERLARTIPIGEPEHHPAFELESNWTIPERFVATLANARVVGASGAVICADHRLVVDLSPAFGVTDKNPHGHPIFRGLRLPPMHDQDGSVCVLAARGAHNYYHFLLDSLPRLHLLEAVYPMDAADWFYVSNRLPFQRQYLSMLGVPPERILDPSDYPHVRAERLIVPSLPGGVRMDPRWAIEYLRSRLLDVGRDIPSQRNIYITRGAKAYSRSVRNEREVLEMLKAFDFTLVQLDKMTVEDQISAFRSAGTIIAPHGAGLANMVFCRPGTNLIELFSPQWINTTYWKISCQMGYINYRYVVGARSPHRDRKAHLGGDIEVPVDTLRAVLTAAWGS